VQTYGVTWPKRPMRLEYSQRYPYAEEVEVAAAADQIEASRLLQ